MMSITAAARTMLPPTPPMRAEIPLAPTSAATSSAIRIPVTTAAMARAPRLRSYRAITSTQVSPAISSDSSPR
jgi:hypothetical protein